MYHCLVEVGNVHNAQQYWYKIVLDKSEFASLPVHFLPHRHHEHQLPQPHHHAQAEHLTVQHKVSHQLELNVILYLIDSKIT
jgi:hypothetical protein